MFTSVSNFCCMWLRQLITCMKLASCLLQNAFPVNMIGSKQQSQLFISQFFRSISALCCFIVHCFWYNLEVYFFYSSWNLIDISLLLDAAVKLRSTSDFVVHPLMELLQQFDECLSNWLIIKGFHRHYFLPWKYIRQPPSHVQHGFSSTHNGPVISPLP